MRCTMYNGTHEEDEVYKEVIVAKLFALSVPVTMYYLELTHLVPGNSNLID